MEFTKEKLLAKGRRGLVYLGTWQGKHAVLKVKRPSSDRDTIVHEAEVLQEVNDYGIGPRYYKHGKDPEPYLIMEYIDGPRFEEAIPRLSRQDVVKILKVVLLQCFVLDTIKYTKGEMQRPYKHILLKHGYPVLIDFERTRYEKQPKNIKHFCEYLSSKRMEAHGISFDLIPLAKKYHESYSWEVVEDICDVISE